MTDDSARLVRVAYTSDTIIVYQAYAPEIAEAAVAAGTFVPPFSRDRMTWIKPSFGWMMHRSGWAGKPGLECVLAIEISRAGFEWALAHSCLSHYMAGLHASAEAWAVLKDSSPVRIQWDPDRALSGEQLPRRAIQIGLSRDAVRRYADEWIRSITDITVTARVRGAHLRAAVAAALGALRRVPMPPETAEVAASLEQAVALADRGPASPATIAALGAGWVGEEALAIAVHCALTAADFRSGVLAAVNHGGDSDSTGAICGNLLGASLGSGVIDGNLLAALEGRDVIVQVADDLHAVFAGGQPPDAGRYPTG